jgi:hypothetical protein
MDVAGFVGFATTGPVNVPVPVEDSTSFAEVFGGNTPLAWDAQRGESAIAQLAPAVRAFFRNGGRRAWIVRVAGADAQRTLLPIPNLVAAAGGDLGAAALPARSVGRWADDLRVESALVSRPATVVTCSVELLQLQLEVPSGDTIVPGDLLRLRNDPYELLVAVDDVEPASVVPSPTRPGRTVVDVTGVAGSALWLETLTPTPTVGTALLSGGEGATATVTSNSTIDLVEVEVTAAPALAPDPGALLQVTGLASDQRALFLLVRSIQSAVDRFVAIGEPFWVLSEAPAPYPTLAPGDAVERLTIELRVDLDGTDHRSLSDLGLAPGHPRYLGDLPTDEDLYAVHDGEVDPPSPPPFWSAAASPRFPLAGGVPATGGTIFYPLGMEAEFAADLGPPQAPDTALDRDGLTSFDDSLFLDPGVRGQRVDTVLATAEYLRWQSPAPRRLGGIHSLLGLDEVTLVAVPDAVQRGWFQATPEPLPEAPASVPADEPPRDRFERCTWRVLAAVPLSASTPDPDGNFSLSWDASIEADATYVLEESTSTTDWSTARTIYDGPATRLDLYARPNGTYLYRVRVESLGNVSDWSNGVVVRISPPTDWQLLAESDYSPGTLLAVQRALMRMCAARGDLFAVLSMPAHYREAAAIAHADALRSPVDALVAGGPPAPAEPDPVEPLDASESGALAHCALYHPWLTSSLPEAPDQFVRTSPDGHTLGVLADRAATRGAWVAPADVVLRDVVVLDPPIPVSALETLLTAQVNEVRQEPDGFLWLSADTLALDYDLRPINVRRLIALVRRLALLRGVDYVFEVNNDVLQRSIQRGFEATLNTLYGLGAFAGATPTEAFRVDISTANTPQTADAGQLIVELKFAPSRPLTFVTVRLVGDADRSFRVESA